MPLSVLLFEPDKRSRMRMRPFLLIGTGTALYILWALTAYPTQVFVRGNSIVYLNPATNNTFVAILYVIVTCGSLLFSKINDMVLFGIANVVILLDRDGRQALRFHLGMVRVCRGRQRHHPRVLLEEPRHAAILSYLEAM